MQATLSGTLQIHPVFTIEAINTTFGGRSVLVSWNYNGRKESATLFEKDNLTMDINVEIPAAQPKPTLKEALRVIKEELE